jgi:hypothetical protein
MVVPFRTLRHIYLISFLYLSLPITILGKDVKLKLVRCFP